MDPNQLQFAVMREDPQIELEVLSRTSDRGKVFLIGSGGCNALNLKCEHPDRSFTIADPNFAQLELLKKKTQILGHSKREDFYRTFGIGKEDRQALNSIGSYESLFRGLREFIYDFVADREQWLSFFEDPHFQIHFQDRIFKSKYWPIGFQMFFSDELLAAIFGPNAIQHAKPGSYADHFRKILEVGLLRKDVAENYFLHHVLLGHYLEDSNFWPTYLRNHPPWQMEFEYLHCSAQEVPTYADYDLVSLSNIFDCMKPSDIARFSARLSAEMKIGSWLVVRQLNNHRDIRSDLGVKFRYDDDLAGMLHAQDRSLFYSRVHIAQKMN